jgi:hypothetical protein
MARRTLTFAAGAGRHALPAAPLPHAAAATEPRAAVAWADPAPARAMAACSISPVSRSTRGVIDTRGSKPLRNPDGSSSRYPAGLWPAAGRRAAADSGRHTDVERVPSPQPAVVARRRGLWLSAHLRSAGVANSVRAAAYRPRLDVALARPCCRKTCVRTTPATAGSNELGLQSTNYQTGHTRRSFATRLRQEDEQEAPRSLSQQ